jgi:hypothetical protein
LLKAIGAKLNIPGSGAFPLWAFQAGSAVLIFRPAAVCAPRYQSDRLGFQSKVPLGDAASPALDAPGTLYATRLASALTFPQVPPHWRGHRTSPFALKLVTFDRTRRRAGEDVASDAAGSQLRSCSAAPWPAATAPPCSVPIDRREANSGRDFRNSSRNASCLEFIGVMPVGPCGGD